MTTRIAEALSRWSKAWSIFHTHETFIALTLLYCVTILTQTRFHLVRRSEMIIKLTAVLHLMYVILIRAIRLTRLISASQGPRVVPHQHLHAQPQPAPSIGSGVEVPDRSFAPNVRYSHLSHMSHPRHANKCLPATPGHTAPTFACPRLQAAQSQPAPPIGYCTCTCARTCGTNRDQQGTDNNAASFPRQIGINTQGWGSRIGGGRRGRSPQRRGIEHNTLAVSSGLVQLKLVLTVS
jgi:hypothetical protein